MSRPRRLLVASFVSAYLLVQTIVPALGLHALYEDGDGGTIGHFGWQMFAYTGE